MSGRRYCRFPASSGSKPPPKEFRQSFSAAYAVALAQPEAEDHAYCRYGMNAERSADGEGDAEDEEPRCQCNQPHPDMADRVATARLYGARPSGQPGRRHLLAWTDGSYPCFRLRCTRAC